MCTKYTFDECSVVCTPWSYVFIYSHLKLTIMKQKTMRLKGGAQKRSFSFLYPLFLFVCSVFILNVSHAQTRVKKTVFQAFWWNFANNNFPEGWSNYLTELAPRLKSMGFDAIWIPPSYKNGSTGSVGYSPFDHYDLGDKYQKGGSGTVKVKTRMGTKDELLRLIGVMHANGIEVIQDVVLNHVDNAGSNSGVGGQDPEPNFSLKNASGFKNFRYVSYATPYVDDSQNDYWSRNGRWMKNYPNFYPNLNNNCTTGDICTPFFGPDISFESSAFGQSSNIPTSGTATIGSVTRPFANPAQSANYMRDNARNWIMWFKKQTGVDGWRWDAVKHFPIYVQEDLIYNTKYVLPAFAQGGEAMLNIGEWIGNKSDLDNYVTNVRSGSEEHTGTFDFSLRGYGPNGGLYSMVLGMGGYNMQNLPGEQQDKRFYNYTTQRVHRTCPFVNSHDTYRPILNTTTGNFSKALGDASGWDLGQELGGNGQHIDPREPRLFSAYAVAFAMDGNPTVFFEDLFDIGTTGKRFTHLPASTTDLPVREDIVNIVQAHQRLQFKNGDYGVPTSLGGAQAPFYAKGGSGDHIVFERYGRALIGVTDKFSSVANNTNDEEVWVNAADPAWRNTDLYDYSGAHGLTTTRVQADGRVLIRTAPVGHTISGARGHGYSIWAPRPAGVTFSTVNDLYNYLAGYTPSRGVTTTHEWEMADDLGDSHPNSLRQGGRLPDNSVAERTAGRIYAQAGTVVTYRVFPEVNGRSQTIALYNTSGSVLSQVTGTSSNTTPLSGTYTVASTGWIRIGVKNSTSTQLGQRVWVNVTYTAPATVNTRTSPANLRVAPVTPAAVSAPALSIYPNPAAAQVALVAKGIKATTVLQLRVINAGGETLLTTKGTLQQLQQTLNLHIGKYSPGVYILQTTGDDFSSELKLIRQ
jgi:glycosidase